MKLSIFSRSFFVLALFFSGCADKQIRPISESSTPREQFIAYDLGPEKESSIFLEKADEYGLKDVQAVHLYAVDVNRDGLTDLVTLDDFFSAPKFYLFDGKAKKFKLSPNPFNEIVRGSYLIFTDFNHDFIYDVLIGSLNQKSEMTQYPVRVYQGVLEKGILKYVMKSVLPTGIQPTASVAPFDFNLDGELDLYLANWFSQKEENPKPVVDNLMEGKGFEFRDVGSFLKSEYEYNKSLKLYTNATPTFGVSVCDVDKNGLPDIMTSNSNGYYNKLWLNIDGKNFVNYGTESGYGADDEGSADSRGGGNSFFSLCGDYNNDEIIDVVMGNLSKETDPESRDKSAILTGRTKNFPPHFYRSDFYQSDNQANWSEGNRRGAWIDYNLDGLSDILIANSGFPPSSRLSFFEQENDHAYTDKAKDYGLNLMNPSGVITLDLNGDGLMDFISGQSKVRAGDVSTRVYVYINQTKRNGRGSVRFHLQGKKSNSYGISSTLTLITDKHKRFGQAVYSYGSLPSQSEEGVYFAYDKEIPKEVEVRWSYGEKDKLERIKPLVKKYSLTSFNMKGSHLEFNLCEDGRILRASKNCY